MKIAIRLFIQQHVDGNYTVTVPAFPGVSAYGGSLEGCINGVGEALPAQLAEIPAAFLQQFTARPDQTLERVQVELRPPGKRERYSRKPLMLAVSLLLTPQEDGQFLVEAPRIVDPGLEFYIAALEELSAAAQDELANYFHDTIASEILKYRMNPSETIDVLEVEFEASEPAGPAAPGQPGQGFWALRQAGIELTAAENESWLTRADHRETEVQNVLTALAGERPSLVLIGPSGSGKTAIIHEAIRRIRNKQCAPGLQGRQVWSVTGSSLLSGSVYIGQWEAKIANVVAEVREKHHILFVEDVAALVEAGRHDQSNTNMAEYMRPYLQSGSVTLIGESSPERWRYAERLSPGFIAQFRTLQVKPSADAQTLSILNSVISRVEKKEAVRIAPSASQAAVDLTTRFLPYRAQPGKSLRLIEQALSDTNQQRIAAESTAATSASAGAPSATSSPAQPAVLERKDVVATFTRQSGLPEFILADDVQLNIANVRTYFAERVIGQEQAVEAMVNLIAVVKAGLNDTQKPLGSFLFIGPTGVGKTQMAKTVAKYVFGREERLIRFDMSEYRDPYGVRRLIGAPGSGAEGELTGKVREEPFCVLLLDEFEKAAPEVFDLFLQVLGEGRLTDATGATTSFQNAIILMTSNLGAGAREQRALGLRSESQGAAGSEGATGSGSPASSGRPATGVRPPTGGSYWQRKVEEHFRPEFVNRIDQIVAFQPLSPESMRKIAQRELGEVLLRQGLTRRNLLVQIDDGIIDLLLEQGFSTAYGARPLKRAVEQRVVVPLALFLAGHTGLAGDVLNLHREGDEVTLSATHVAEEESRPVLVSTAPLTLGQKRKALNYPDLIQGFGELRLKLQDWAGRDTVVEMRNERDARLARTRHPTFWDDPAAARATLSRFYFLDRLLNRLQQLSEQAAYLEELAGLVHRQRDEGYRWDLAESFQRLTRDTAFLEVELLCAPLDRNHNARLTFTPVRSPSQDEDGAAWAARVAAMYLSWANRKGYDIEAVANLVLLPESQRVSPAQRAYPYRWQPADVRDCDALIKAVSELEDLRELVVLLSGVNVYGFLRGEAGYHRGSTQRPNGERTQQLAAVGVEVWAGSGEELLGQVLEERAAGARGQRPSSPVEVVRHYHLDGQRYVRDPRTKAKHTNPTAVLAGDLDDFILAYLRQAEPAGVE